MSHKCSANKRPPEVTTLGHFDHTLDLLESFARRRSGTTYRSQVIASIKLRSNSARS